MATCDVASFERKTTSCGPLALYKLTTIFVVDRKDDFSFLKGMSNDDDFNEYA
jgi:hypothetical protein